MKYLIIDGYNAISKIKRFNAKKDIILESSRMSFIRALAGFRQTNSLFDKIIIVFDGKGDSIGLAKELYGNIEILYSNRDKDADQVIVDIIKAPSKNKITVASDDNFIKNHARAFSCDIMGIKKLEELISLKKEPLRGKIIEKDFGNKNLDKITNELKEHWGIK